MKQTPSADSYGEQEEELTSQERFALDKKKFAQQLKEELLYGKKEPAKKK